MNEAEKRMYGMSAEDIREEYLESLTARLSGLEMVVAGILSDCQELLAMRSGIEGGSKIVSARAAESVRKQLNIAKFIVFEMMDRREAEEDVQARYRAKVDSLKDIPAGYGKEAV